MLLVLYVFVFESFDFNFVGCCFLCSIIEINLFSIPKYSCIILSSLVRAFCKGLISEIKTLSKDVWLLHVLSPFL